MGPPPPAPGWMLPGSLGVGAPIAPPHARGCAAGTGRDRTVTSGSRVSAGDARAVLDDALGDLAHREAQVHRGLLDPAERLGLGEVELLHQQALGPLDRLAGLQPLGEVGDLGLERASSANRLTAISIAGTRSAWVNGLTR